ncbi:MAG: hypothetical protein SOR72_07865 [Hornefia sp.]|nr:hypothetical protein [Hornefia sp.]
MKVLIIIALYSILYIYTILQLNHWLKLISKSVIPRILTDLIFIALGLMPVGAAFLGEGSLRNILETNGNLWFGFLIYFTGCLIIFHVFRGIAWIINHKNPDKAVVAPWIGVTVLSICVLVSMSLNVFGHVNSHKVRTTKYNITSSKKTTSSGKLKVVLISDLQLGANTHVEQLKAMVREINKQDADAVFVAGNTFSSYFSSLKNPDLYSEILKGIKAKQGVYAVYGNTDIEQPLFAGFTLMPNTPNPSREQMSKYMTDSGFQILEDITIYINGVQIVARTDDSYSTQKRASVSALTGSLDSRMPIFVLQNRPDDFKRFQESGVDVALSGHTRDGQYFPGNIIDRFLYENPYGLKTIHNVYSVVTSGIGTSGAPIRIGTKSEIAVIDFQY